MAFLSSTVGHSQNDNELLPEQLLERAIQSQENGDHTRAIVLLNKYLYHVPANSKAYVLRGHSRASVKDFEGAVLDYSTSLELQPDQYEVLMARAPILFKLGYYERAKYDFKLLLKLPPGETNTIFYRKSVYGEGTDKIMTAQGTIHPQFYNYLGLIELRLNRCQASIQYLDSAILLNPVEADYYVNRALAKRDCQVSSSYDDFKAALQLNPNHAIALHNLAVQTARSGSHEDAERELTQAIELDSTLSYPFAERGYYRMQRGNYNGALQDYTQALALNNSVAEVWLNRGIVKEKLGDSRGAYSDFTKAIDLKEDLSLAWLNRGNLFVKQGKLTEAIEDYSTAIAFQPDYGAAYYNRAIAYQKLKLDREACNDLKRAQSFGFTISARLKHLVCGD